MPGFDKLQLLLRDAPIGIAMVTPEPRFVYINAWLAEMNGRPPEAHLGRRLDEVIPQLAAEVRDSVERVVRTGKPVSGPETIVGERRLVAHYYPIERSAGEREAVGVVVQDVTLSQTAEQALRASEERFRTIVELAPVMIDAFDENGRCLLWNLECVRTLGWTLEDVRRTDDPIALFYPDSATRDAVIESIRRADGRFREYRVLARDGTTRNQLWADFRLAGGESISMGVDITDRKQAQEELSRTLVELELRVDRRTADLKKANVALEREVREREKTSAELFKQREQLRALASELSLAEERERRRIAADLHDSIVQELALSRIKLGGLRDAAVSEGGVESIDARVGEIVGLIDQAIKESRSLLFEVSPPVLYELGFEAAIEWLAEHIEERHGLQCQIELDGHPPPLPEDTRIVLFQATRELLINVVKHAQAASVQIALGRDGGDLRVVVEDDGVGIPTGADRRSTSGSGFGLFSIRERLGLLGGGMHVEAVPHGGTRVTLRVPVDSATVVD